MLQLADICVLLPAYNEATEVGAVIDKLRKAGVENIVVVNDGSHDDTSKVARSKGVLVIDHPINLGAGAAVQTGIELARNRGWLYLLIMDADGQHDVSDIFVLKSKMESSCCDIVVGSRFLANQKGMPPSRKLYNGIGNRMTNLFAKHRYTDSQSGLRLLNRKAIERINLEVNDFGFCSEMLIKAEKSGLGIEETPTAVIYTEYSVSKGQGLQVGISTAFDFLWHLMFK